MLQTMAHTQDAKWLGISQESFRRAIAGMGIPDFLFGKSGQLDLEYRKIRHSMEERPTQEINPGRVLDADDESIRQLFEQIKKEMETQLSNQSPRLVNMIQAPIAVARGSGELVRPTRWCWTGWCGTSCRTALGPGSWRCWVGRATSPRTPAVDCLGPAGRRGGTVSSRRAGQGPAGTVGVVFVGLGPSNPKLQTLGFVPGKSAILIAVTAKGE